jgi:hypothetical protein
MIQLTDIYGRLRLIHPGQIAQVQEAGVSQKWHGVRANVQMAVDGKWVEVREDVPTILAALEAGR